MYIGVYMLVVSATIDYFIDILGNFLNMCTKQQIRCIVKLIH